MVILALSANGWVGYARVARGQVLALRERDFVTAAVALGASNRRVIFRHLIPNLLGPALVQMSFGFGGDHPDRGGAVVPRPRPTGRLHVGRDARPGAHVPLEERLGDLYALIPGLAIMWVVLGANLLGDGLRDRFDPRQRGRS